MLLAAATDGLPDVATLITLGVALLMSLIVSACRVSIERGRQVRAGEALTPASALLGDTLFGALAGLALVLLGGATLSLGFRASIGLAMFGGAIGPSAWDFVAAIVAGRYKVSLTKGKEDGHDA